MCNLAPTEINCIVHLQIKMVLCSTFFSINQNNIMVPDTRFPALIQVDVYLWIVVTSKFISGTSSGTR
jgi:hypothetical protein